MRGRILLAILFLGGLWAMPLGIVHASPVATSLPGVKAGDNATYVFVNLAWQTNNATAFPSPFTEQSIFNTTRDIALRVIDVSSSNVTFTITYYFLNGTSALVESKNVDVQTQDFCFTDGLGGSQTLCSRQGPNAGPNEVLAAGLQAPDAIGEDPSLTLNETVTRTILGAQRTVNFLNVTSRFSCIAEGSIAECRETLSREFAWDQASGVAVSFVQSNTLSSSVGSATESVSIVIASTNIWTSSPPIMDFSITSNPSSITLQGGGSGSSTITLTSLNGFTATVNLQASTSSPQLSCSLSTTSVTLVRFGNLSSTLSCRGSQGTYTVTVIGTAGNLSHSTTLTYTILHGHRGHHF